MEPVDITAGRLHLRPWQAGDEPALLALFGDPETQRWTSRPVPYLPEHATETVQRTAPARWADGSRLSWAVCDSTSGQVLGEVVLSPGTDPGVWLVDFACLPASRGRGVATGAVGAACRWAFDALAAQRMQWCAYTGNVGSRRVAEKAGFSVEGVLRSGLLHRGALRDGWIGGLLPGDPQTDTARIPAYADRTDGVVTLRRWRSGDAADVARACADPETARWLPVPVPYTAEAGQQYVQEMVPGLWVGGAAANVAVVDAASGGLLGAIGLTLRDGIGEVGYWTAPWARGRGVATRATVLHTAWALDALALPRVELLADVGNLGSQRVAERAGFVREGVARALRPLPRSEGRADMVVYARVAAR